MRVQEENFEDLVTQSFDAMPTEVVGETRIVDSKVHRQKRVNLTDKLEKIAASEGFEVQEMLGQGGMGAVLLAKDRELGRMVALKFLTMRAKDERIRNALRSEAEKASRLTHENITQVYSWHQVGPLTFFAMEYVDGENLYQYVMREYRLTVIEALRIIAEACSGVSAAHEFGILHRDIKPQNIMLDRKGRVKVADFGLASSAAEESKRAGHEISGTLGFMSPEQARGEAATPASDVYSLGATLYFALAKATPYGQIVNSEITLARNQSNDFTPIEQSKSGLPRRVVKLVQHAMAEDPSDRPKDANKFREELHAVMLSLNDETTERRLQREERKAPGWWNLKALVIGFVLGLLIGATCMWAFIYVLTFA